MSKLPLKSMIVPIRAIFNLVTHQEGFRATSEHLTLESVFKKAIDEFMEEAQHLPELLENFNKTGMSDKITGSEQAIQLALVKIIPMLGELKGMPRKVGCAVILMMILELYSECNVMEIISSEDMKAIEEVMDKVLPEIEKIKEAILKAKDDPEEAAKILDELAKENISEFKELISPNVTTNAQKAIDQARKMLGNND